MATIFDASLLTEFQDVFPFLFVLIVTYAILSNLPYFSEKRKIFALLIATALAMMTLFSPIALKAVRLMAPWFVLLLVLVLFVLLMLMILGADAAGIKKFLEDGEFNVGLILVILVGLIMIGSVFQAFTEEGGDIYNLTARNGTSTEDLTVYQVLFHPKVLGMSLVLIIAAITIKQMTAND